MKKLFLLILCALFYTTTFSQRSVNIVTFNLRYENNQDVGNLWQDRRDNVAMLVRFHQADIFCTQETLFPQRADLLRLLSGWKTVGVGRDDGKQGGEYSPIFYNTSRFVQLRTGYFWLNESTTKPALGWDAACIRICTWIELKEKKSNKILFVFNTHVDHMGKVAQANSVHLILRKIQEITQGKSPVILTGDFNMTPDNESIKLIKEKLLDSYDISKLPPYGPDGTFNNFVFSTSIKDRIDYIFVNRKVSVLRYGILSDSKNDKFFSDHLPVLAEVNF
jgi:endonuclease/exonuclease/phosphatase family metal-dependent hydrolase